MRGSEGEKIAIGKFKLELMNWLPAERKLIVVGYEVIFQREI